MNSQHDLRKLAIVLVITFIIIQAPIFVGITPIVGSASGQATQGTYNNVVVLDDGSSAGSGLNVTARGLVDGKVVDTTTAFTDRNGEFEIDIAESDNVEFYVEGKYKKTVEWNSGITVGPTLTISGGELRPTISMFDISNPTGKEVKVTIKSDELLSDIEVDITGSESLTLSEDDFSELEGTYTTTYPGSSDGTYTATLTTAKNSAGNDGANNETDSVSVGTGDDEDTTPTADAGSNQIIDIGTVVMFNATGSMDDTGIVSYKWKFGDGTIATGATPSHTYSSPGQYTARLTVTDDAGNTDTDSIIITVEDTTTDTPDNTPPFIDIKDNIYFDPLYTGTAITFDATDSTDNVGIVSYEWSFGDGTTATGANTSHTYSAPGEYEVTLILTDAAGNTATLNTDITIENSPAIEKFNLSNDSFEQGDTIKIDVSLSGSKRIAKIDFLYSSTDGPNPFFKISREFDPNIRNGTYTINSQLSDDVPPGTYEIDYISTEDSTGNTREYYDELPGNEQLTIEQGTDSEPYSSIEFVDSEEARVSQGNNVNISNYIFAPRDQAASGSLELRVDQNNDGVFSSDETVAVNDVSLPSGDIREYVLTYSNVELANGTYSYQAKFTSDGGITTSGPNETLLVGSDGSSDDGSSDDGSDGDDDTGSDDPKYGFEVQPEAAVSQGNNVNISTYISTPLDQAALGALELRVDQNNDGVFSSDETVAVSDVSLRGDNREVLTYSNVELANGTYSYQARFTSDGETITSGLNGTLLVGSDGGSDDGSNDDDGSSDDGGDNDGDTGSDDPKYGFEMQPEAAVSQGNNVNISTYLLPQRVQAASGSLELRVDQNNDGVFSSDETVTVNDVSLPPGEIREYVLIYSNVELANGTYSYQARFTSDGETITSGLNGTLLVGSDGGSDDGSNDDDGSSDDESDGSDDELVSPDPITGSLSESEVFAAFNEANPEADATTTITVTNQSGNDIIDNSNLEIMSNDTNVATVTGDKITGLSEGTAKIEANLTENGQSETDTVLINVTARNRTGVELRLGSTLIGVDGDTEATVIETLENDLERDLLGEEVTSDAELSSSDTDIAEANGSTIEAQTLSSSADTADVEITASVGDETDSTTLTITRQLDSINVEVVPGEVTINETTPQPESEVTVTATFDAGNTRDITDSATVSITNSIAEFDRDSNTLTALQKGTVDVNAEFDDEGTFEQKSDSEDLIIFQEKTQSISEGTATFDETDTEDGGINKIDFAAGTSGSVTVEESNSPPKDIREQVSEEIDPIVAVDVTQVPDKNTNATLEFDISQDSLDTLANDPNNPFNGDNLERLSTVRVSGNGELEILETNIVEDRTNSNNGVTLNTTTPGFSVFTVGAQQANDSFADRVKIVNETLEHPTVDAGESTQHTLSFDARNVSADGNGDEFADEFDVTFPEEVILEEYSNVDIDAQFSDVEQSGNTLTFSVSPDGGGTTQVSVEMDVTLSPANSQ